MPVYDQQFVKPDLDTASIKVGEDNFLMLFNSASTAFCSFYLSRVNIEAKALGQIFSCYLAVF